MRGAHGARRFCVFHPAGASPRGAVLYIHPFAEEMNKTRRMAALQSRALAAARHAVLQVDLLGCGDSDGDFGDATWERWIADVVEACGWLRAQAGDAPLWLWGLRAGCLLAAEAATRIDDADGPGFVFWQPPASGRQQLQQFLRLKAAARMQGGGAGRVMDELRGMLARSEPVEVAGYTVSAALAHGFEASTLRAPRRPTRVEWFTVSAHAGAYAGDAAACPPEALRWRQAGHAVRWHAVQGPAFWQTVEIEEAPALLDATVAALAEAQPA